jgi:integrase
MLDGCARQMGFGSIHDVSLSDARKKAKEARALIRDEGKDPIEVRRERRAQASLERAARKTFRECAEGYIADHQATWKNPKHRAQWPSTLKRYAYPIFGNLPVGQIDKRLVLEAIGPIWVEKPETAARVRGRIALVLDWAKARDYRTGDNPAEWNIIKQLLPGGGKRQKRTRHHPALPYQEMAAFMAELRAREGVSIRALEFTALTAARTGAVIGATWDEIDLNTSVWTVPPDRAGTKITGEEPKPRRVPLSDRAISILNALPRERGNPHVFIGAEASKGLSDMAMLEVMRGIRPGYVPHGLRSTFKDWCSETTSYANEVSEAALWHVVADKVEAAYRRGDLFEKRRRLMQDWATYVMLPSRPATIVPLRRA